MKNDQIKDRSMLNEIVQPLTDWYRQNKRILPWRDQNNAYYTWVSEIMLQQTRVEAVKPYFQRFIGELPDVQALAECPEEKLMKLWEGLGYYNRVRNMQTAARTVVCEYEGVLPASYEELLLLHNYDDVYGLIQLSSITAYNAVLEENVTYTGYSVEYSDDTNKNGDLIINYTLPCAVPIPVIHLDNNGYAIRINGNTMKIKLPLITDNLRLYYSDYKNYYYLPYEDTAIHKSVAAYVDAECKVKATRETAYTKKFASFIKLPCYNTDSLQTSEYIFRYEYNDANIYLLYDKKELPEDIILQAVHILITFFCRKTTH